MDCIINEIYKVNFLQKYKYFLENAYFCKIFSDYACLFARKQRQKGWETAFGQHHDPLTNSRIVNCKIVNKIGLYTEH